jgi:hypothetical protein
MASIATTGAAQPMRHAPATIMDIFVEQRAKQAHRDPTTPIFP